MTRKASSSRSTSKPPVARPAGRRCARPRTPARRAPGPPRRAAAGTAAKIARRSSLEPVAGRRGDREHARRRAVAEAPTPVVDRSARARRRRRSRFEITSELRQPLEPGPVGRELAADGLVARRTGSPASSSAASSAARPGGPARRQRSTWARNSCPSPAPSAAPSIRPGMSARTSWRSPSSIVPSTGSSGGERVVGHLRARPASAGRAARTCRRSAARPAPRRRAASAAARSSRTRPRARARRSGASGGSRWRSACCRARRHRRARRRPAGPARSRSKRSPSRPSTWVPGGTRDHVVLAPAPRGAACPGRGRPRPPRW